MTTPLLEGTGGGLKMSKSLGNYIGVTEPPADMYAKLMSISDELMWRYYLLLTDLAPSAIEAERAAATPMASKMALGRRIVSDFHGPAAAAAAEEEWRRVHQQKQAPVEMPTVEIAPGRHRARDLLARPGLAASRSDAERLLRQGGARKDGAPLASGAEIDAAPGDSFVLSIGAQRFVRFSVTAP
jgi:tyrosyl-tRNA synthetase